VALAVLTITLAAQHTATAFQVSTTASFSRTESRTCAAARSIIGVTDTDVSCAVLALCCLQLPPSSSHAVGSLARSHAAAAALQSPSQQLTRQGPHSVHSSALHVATRDLHAELSSAAHERNVRRRAQLVQDAAAAVAAAAAAPASAVTLNSAPAAVAAPRRPALPQLTSEDKQELAQGLRVQRQTRQGGAGSGFVVVDVKAEPATVIEILKSYRAYTVSIEHSLTQLTVL
jgi:hypothetical protein